MAKSLSTGIYEQIINKKIITQLADIDPKRLDIKDIDHAEAASILTSYLEAIIKKSLEYTAETSTQDNPVNAQIQLANQIIQLINNTTQNTSILDNVVDKNGQQLLGIAPEESLHLIQKNFHLPRPATSLIETSLFTGAKAEPSMFHELKKEIISSDRIDMLVSFIKWSGLVLIFDELKEFSRRGGKLRLIATSYMGATDVKAIDEISQLPNAEVRISYDTKRTRLHAKAYIFYRNTEYHTAYIGSSNLSNAAISSGLEWNVKITSHDSPATMNKVTATFDSYWHAPEFEPYTSADKEYLAQAITRERHPEYVQEQTAAYLFTIHPYAYQRQLLDALNIDRQLHNNYRNLVVAATGTGKTVLAAFDYKRFCDTTPNKPHRLLFIAHREEILDQSRDCFRTIMRDANFGGKFVGNNRPNTEQQLNHLFMSIQTFNSQDWTAKTAPTSYDFIIIDEAHHVAAKSYQKLITYYHPSILLGLTATPERMDGIDITKYFGGHIAAELRLSEAIERGMLCPFHYFGVSDNVDLSSLQWERGGYKKSELEHVYVFEHEKARRRANMIIESINRYVSNLSETNGIGFCVSCAHAEFMAEYFNECGIKSLNLSGLTPEEERRQAKEALQNGNIRFIFVVDLYNEGVDIPNVNTILFLRPTESLTIFLQQLGRGLRLAENKDCLTVLDFIGQANKKYRFEEKFTSLLSHTHRGFANELKHGITSVPHGCYIQLEEQAKEIVLDNIKAQLSNKRGLIQKIIDFRNECDNDLTLDNFLDYYHINLTHIYRKNAKESFQRLCVLAGVIPDFTEDHEDILTSACSKFAAIDSKEWLDFLSRILPNLKKITTMSFTIREERLLQMTFYSIWNDSLDQQNATEIIHQRLASLARNEHMIKELLSIVTYRRRHLTTIGQPNKLTFDCPLEVHCHYTRDQLCAAMDMLKPTTLRQGVYFHKEKHCDIFLITLNKSEKDYSPSTMYQDYSMNQWLFHWESQSTTSDSSPTAQRYFNHRELNHQILLFVREYSDDAMGKAPYMFLGTANHISHKGSNPVSIVWKLDTPIPAQFLNTTNKLVVE